MRSNSSSEENINVMGRPLFRSKSKLINNKLWMVLMLAPLLVGQMISCIHYTKFIKQTFANFYSGDLSDKEFSQKLTHLFSFGSMYSVGGMVGYILAWWLIDSIGRKKSAIIFTVFTMTGCFFRFASAYASIGFLIAGRFLDGMGTVALLYICEIYTKELAPPKHREWICLYNSIFISIGIFLSGFLSLNSILGRYWQFACFVPAGICISLAIALFVIPESPIYTFKITRSSEKLNLVMKTLRGEGESVESEKRKIREEVEYNLSRSSIGFHEFVTSRGSDLHCSRRVRIITAFLLHFTNQICGWVTALAFTGDILETVNIASPDTHALIVSGLHIFGVVFFGGFSRLLPEKLFILIGHTGIVIFTTLFILVQSPSNYTTTVFLSMIPVMATIGPASLTLALTDKMFTKREKWCADLLVAYGKWSGNFLALLIVPLLLGPLKEKIMFINLGSSAMMILYLVILQFTSMSNSTDTVEEDVL